MTPRAHPMRVEEDDDELGMLIGLGAGLPKRLVAEVIAT